LAVIGDAAFAADYKVTVYYSIAGHTIAFHLKGEYIVTISKMGVQGQQLNVFNGLYGRSGGNFACEQYACRRLAAGV
jgi:hypothetical protein